MSYRRAQAGGVTITTATVKKIMAALSMERVLAVAGPFSQENAAITNLLRGTIRSHSSRLWKTFPMKAACSPNRYGTDLIGEHAAFIGKVFHSLDEWKTF